MSKHISTSIKSALLVTTALWAVGGIPAPAFAGSFSCTSTASGEWTSAAIWSACNSAIPDNGGGNTYDATLANSVALTGADGPITIGNLTVNSGAQLQFDNSGAGGGDLTVTGNLVNQSTGPFEGGGVSVGNGGMTTADLVTVGGNLTNTGAILNLTGGNQAGATATMQVTGAAPSTLTGTYDIIANKGGAVLKFGSGQITTIGDNGSNVGDLYIDGANAAVESGGVAGNSALTSLGTIADNGVLDLRDGASVTTSGGLTIVGGGNGRLEVDGNGGQGGSAVTVNGNLVNASTGAFDGGGVSLGNAGMTAADQLTVNGSLTNTGAILVLTGGNQTGATATMQVSGAAPSTLTGTYDIAGNKGGAVLNFGSGHITTIGDNGTNAGDLYIDGANAAVESGGVAGNSALTSLGTIADNGVLDLRDGASVTTSGGVTVVGGGNGRLEVDGNGGQGGSHVTINGNLVNDSNGSFDGGGVSLGNADMANADQLTVNGNLTNAGAILVLTGGNQTDATATMQVSGAAPSTLTGTYDIAGNKGGAVLKFDSGQITTIGDNGSNAGDLLIDGANASVESGGVAGNSALASLGTIADNGVLDLRDGASVTTSGGLTVASGGTARLAVDGNGGQGGSAVTVNGNLVNASSGPFSGGGVSVGNSGMTTADQLTVNGSLTNTGGILTLTGGNQTAATATMQVSGAAPSTLTGTYDIVANTGGAVLNFGSGHITAIGDNGTNAGDLLVDGANASVESGGVAGNSALTSLGTIADNGVLDLQNGASVTTSGGVTVAGGGTARLAVDGNAGQGGSNLTINGNLVNDSTGAFSSGGVAVGNGGMTTSDLLTVNGTLDNAASAILEISGNNTNATVQGRIAANGPVVNAGTVNIETNGLITVGAGNAYTQTGGQTNVTGTLTAPTVNDNGGIIQGTGTINGKVVNAGTLAGGVFTSTAPGTLTINGGLTNTSGGTVQTLITGTGAGQTSVVNVASGPVALQGGTLNTATSNFAFAPGQAFTVATFTPGSLTGLFSALASGSASGDGVTLDLGGGNTLDAIYNNNSGNIELAVVATPATTEDTWTGGTGTWSTAGQWDHGVPLSYSETTIGATNSGNVTLNQDATVDSLTINSGNTLAYQSGAPASLTVGKTVTVNSGGALALGTAGDTLAAGGAISNAGTMTIGNGAGVLSLTSAANQAGGTVQLAGGSLTAPSYSNAGTTAGFGTVAPAIANTGLVQASGGTLVAQNGIQGSGAITVNSGATLNLSQAGTGSSAGTLAQNGALNLGNQNITVSSDYNNANFGTGNSFNARANVTGTGQILASGNVALSVTGADVSGGTSPTLALGNVHVGSTTNTNFSINNTGTTGPSLRGAVQNSGITNGAVTVAAANFGPIATGGSQTESLTYNPTAAGALSGQSFDVVSNFDNVAGKTVSVTGAAYDYANPVVNNSQPINLGNFHVGSAPASTALSISNTVVSNAAYQEGLDADVAGTTGSATSNNGSVSLLTAGGTNTSSITVGLNGSTAGVETGKVTLNLTSDGSGTSGLGTTALPQQAVSVTGTGYNLAQSNTIGPINLGVLHVGSGIVSQGVTVANIGPAGSYTEGLDSSFGAYTNSGGSLTPTFSGSIANLAAGSSNGTSMQVAINTATAGSVSGNIEILQDSNGSIDGLGNTTLPSQNPAVSGTVEATVTNLAEPQINNAPVNFGNIRIGTTLPTTGLSVTNAAPVGPFTEGLIANATGASGGATATGGFGSPGNALAPGQTNSTGIQIGINTATAGHINGSAAVDFGSDGTPFGGTVTDLGTTDVAVTGNVYRLASGSAPGTVSLGAARVGGSLSGGIAVTNSASNDGYSEALDAAISGTTPEVNSASGSVSRLAAGQTNASGLSAGLNTATAGHISGTATVAFESDGTGIDGGAPVSVGSEVVTVQGNVYTPAVPVVNTNTVNFGIVHVGQSVTPQAVSVSNGAAVTALNDTLVGGFGTVSGPFSGSGTLAGVAAGQTDSSSLQVGLDTSAAGVFTGTANLDLASHDTELADLAVDTAPITMMATVNNYAVATLGKTSGDGTFSGGANAYSLDFGTILLGSGSKSTDLFAENAATGPSDLLSGGFQILSGSGEFDLTGFNPFAGLAAGQQYTDLGVSFSDLALGSFSEEIEMLPTGYNLSGYSGALPYVTLTIDGTVAGSAPVPEPGSLALLLTGLLALVGVEVGRRGRKSRRG